MERTRDEVVRILHERGERSVAELAEEIGVSSGSIRRHMDLMVADGLVVELRGTAADLNPKSVRLEYARASDPASVHALLPAGTQSLLDQLLVSDRAIHDTMASMIVHGVFHRHPRLRRASRLR